MTSPTPSSSAVSLPLPTVGRSQPPEDLPAAASDGTRALVDRYGRRARDLRVSITDRCNLRCTYCMPEQGNEWLARTSILTLDEIERVVIDEETGKLEALVSIFGRETPVELTADQIERIM